MPNAKCRVSHASDFRLWLWHLPLQAAMFRSLLWALLKLPLEAGEEPVRHHPRRRADQPLTHLRDEPADLRRRCDVDGDDRAVLGERDGRLALDEAGPTLPVNGQLGRHGCGAVGDLAGAFE